MSIETISQQDIKKESFDTYIDNQQSSYAYEVDMKVKSQPGSNDYDDSDLAPPVKVGKTFCGPDCQGNMPLSNDSGSIKKDVDKRFTAAKRVKTRSSPRLTAWRKLQPRKEGKKLRMPVIKERLLTTPSKLILRPLQPKKSFSVKQRAATNIHSTRTSLVAVNPQPKNNKSNSTITILPAYEPSNSIAPLGTLKLVSDMTSSHELGEKSAKMLTGPPGKVPISRFRSCVPSTGQMQQLATPSQLQALLSSTGSTEQLQALLLSLVRSGQLHTLVPSTSSLQPNKQIPSVNGTQGNDRMLIDTVKGPEPDVSAASFIQTVKPQEVLKPSTVGIQGKLNLKSDVPIPSGKIAINQKEQSASPVHIKVMTPTSSSPAPRPVAGNSYGQLQAVLSSTATGHFGPLQIPVSTGSFGHMHTVQIPYAAGPSYSHLQAMSPPFQAVLPSVAAVSQMIPFQPVIAPASSGQLQAVVPPSGVPVQLQAVQAVIPASSQFQVVSSATGEQLNFVTPSGDQL